MEVSQNILVIDDDPVFRMMVEAFLKKNKYITMSVGSAGETIRILKREVFDLILIDLRLPDVDGLDLLKQIKQDYPSIPLILMTAFVDIRTAVKAIKSGAFEYITKPLNTDELQLAISNALKSSQKILPKKKISEVSYYLNGKSIRSKEIIRNIELVAPTNLSILVTGESGTGKEYVARMIHAHSKRATGRFIAIDCGVLSSELAASELFGHVKGAFTGAAFDKAGYFEQAVGGTVFLDEIGNLPVDVQVMLLRALQEKQIRRIGSDRMINVDVRIIAATNEDLKSAVANGNFREDLYHRLHEFSIYVPPLKERREDILEFAHLFLEQANYELERTVKDFDEEVKDLFLSYDWPGNLREFKNVIKRSVLLCSGTIISKSELPEGFNVSLPEMIEVMNTGFDLKAANSRQEKEYIIKVLEKVKYNKSSAARILNIDRKTLYNKLKFYGIEL